MRVRPGVARIASLAALSLALGLAVAAHAAEAVRADAALRLGPGIERIARLHAQAGQGVLAQRSRRALGEALRELDATLRAALAAAPDPETRENYILAAMLWHDYRDWAQRPPSRESARKLRERTEELAWIAAKGVRLMGEHSRAALSGTAVRAAQLATAAQKIPKVYLWRRWDIRDEGLDRELREARENVPRALDALAATPGVAAEAVESARTQWRFLSDAGTQLDAAPGNARALEFACKAADHILDAMQPLMRESAPGARR
jgi:hypothetical protein